MEGEERKHLTVTATECFSLIKTENEGKDNIGIRNLYRFFGGGRCSSYAARLSRRISSIPIIVNSNRIKVFKNRLVLRVIVFGGSEMGAVTGALTS